MRNMLLPSLLLLCCIGSIACSQSVQDQPPPRAASNKVDTIPPHAPPPDIHPSQLRPWHAELLAAAADYRSWTRVSDNPYWAPTMCLAPPKNVPFRSEVESKGDHGRKLYYLWVKDHGAYAAHARKIAASAMGNPPGMPQPVTQALVKESFVAEEVEVESGRKYFETGAKSALFVMLRGEGEGSHRGWVYGTLTPDGKEVTAAGAIQSCIKCHDEAPQSLFGVQPDPSPSQSKPYVEPPTRE